MNKKVESYSVERVFSNKSKSLEELFVEILEEKLNSEAHAV